MDTVSPEFMEIIKKFKSGGTLVISSGLISDDMLQTLKSSGFFNIVNDNGKYRIDLKYDNVTEWARNNTSIVENIVDDAMKKGLNGIYKQDSKTGKWYTYDESGNIKYYTDLPNGVSSSLEGLGKVLGPLGIAIDVTSMTNALASGDLEKILATGGGIAGGWIGAAIAVAAVDPIPGDSFIIAFVATYFGGYVGGNIGYDLGESIGEALENGNMSWE